MNSGEQDMHKHTVLIKEMLAGNVWSIKDEIEEMFLKNIVFYVTPSSNHDSWISIDFERLRKELINKGVAISMKSQKDAVNQIFTDFITQLVKELENSKPRKEAPLLSAKCESEKIALQDVLNSNYNLF